MINKNALVQSMQEFKARPHRFRVVCGETKNGTEISAPNSKSMHDWMYAIKLVSTCDYAVSKFLVITCKLYFGDFGVQQH